MSFLRRTAAALSLLLAISTSQGCYQTCREDQIAIGDTCAGEEGAECSNDPEEQDSGCLDSLVCAEYKGVSTCIPSATSEVVTGPGFRIKVGSTGKTGLLHFTDDQLQEDVVVSVNYNNIAVPDAVVTFWDGHAFEGFEINHPSFIPSFTPYRHNSEHDIVLETASSACRLINGSENEDSLTATRKFLDYLPTVNSRSSGPGCVLSERLDEAIEARTIAVIDLSDYVQGVGDTIKPLLLCAKRTVIDLPQEILSRYVEGYGANCPAYRTWTAHPADLVAGFGNISPILGISGCMETVPLEIYDNDRDDDCDGQIDEDTSGCTSTTADLICGTDHNVYLEDNCGVRELYEVCETDCDEGSCIDDACIPRTADLVCGTDSNVYLEDNCGVRELYEVCEIECDEGSCLEDLCEMLPACFDGNVRLRDSCTGDWAVSISDYCTTAEHCEDGIGCVPNDPIGGTGSYCDPCTTSLDCLEGWSCITYETGLSWCFAPCETNYDCRSDFSCLEDYDLCTPDYTLACSGGNVWVRDICGAYQNLLDDCSSSETCIDGSCIPETVECSSHADTICYSGDAYWEDSCGNRESIADNCTTLETCVSGACVTETVECTSHADTICYLGNSYWVDSCGERETRADSCTTSEECIDGSCTPCTPHAYTVCWVDPVYVMWADSCGNEEDIAEVCESGERCTDGACAPSTTCTPHTTTTCYSGDSYWVDSCGTRETRADDCSTLETCIDGACVSDTPACDPTADCPDAGCLLYDQFNGSSLQECIWNTSDSPEVEGGNVILGPMESMYTGLPSFDTCTDFTFEIRLRLNRSDEYFITNASENYILHRPSDHPNQIGIACAPRSETDATFYDSFNPTSWNTLKLENSSGNSRLYVNSAFKGTISCSHGLSDLRNLSVSGPATSGELTVDYIKLLCDD